MELFVTGFFSFVLIDGIVAAGGKDTLEKAQFDAAYETLWSSGGTVPVGEFIQSTTGRSAQFHQRCLGVPLGKKCPAVKAESSQIRSSGSTGGTGPFVITYACSQYVLIPGDCANKDMAPRVVIKSPNGNIYYWVKKVMYLIDHSLIKGKPLATVILEIDSAFPVKLPSDIVAWNSGDSFKSKFGVYQVLKDA